jgi:hypothetical protein
VVYGKIRPRNSLRSGDRLSTRRVVENTKIRADQGAQELDSVSAGIFKRAVYDANALSLGCAPEKSVGSCGNPAKNRILPDRVLAIAG